MNETTAIFQNIGLSVSLGLLVGLQREVSHVDFAGLRSFALASLLGTVCGQISQHLGVWVVVGGFVGVCTLLLVANLPKLVHTQDDIDTGITTELAVLLMYGLGVYIVYAPWLVVMVIGGLIAVLLQFKHELRGMVNWLGTDDVRAIMQFVLITFIILPVLPDRTYGPLSVFNPHEVWLMVTLIVGISLGGYILYKIVGGTAGVLLAGLLGGAISSTATTLAYSRRAVADPDNTELSALVISLASMVVFVRMGVLVGVLSAPLLAASLLPFIAVFLLSLAPACVLWWRVRKRPNTMPRQKNPTEMNAAMTMAALYTVMLFLLAAAKTYIGGQQALFAVAVVAGLTDVDAITLSISRLVSQNEVAVDPGWRLVLTAILSNLVFKGGMTFSIAGRTLFKPVIWLFAPPLVGGVLLILLLP